MIQNRYLVVHLVGKGGMGEVYLAVDQRLGSAVALKRTYFADDQTLGNAFEREAKILARLRHPVLPKVSDHFLENGEQYLVMEHIAGEDMSKRLESAKRPFPLSWVMFWADQLLDALSYLHSHEPPIIHRDIKPQNLKLTDENHIVLLDFGLSKDSAMRTITDPTAPAGTSGSIVGYTPHFASMEQIRGTGTNPRSDLYSLSATLYQLMTNTVPIDALARADAIVGGSRDPIVPLCDINRDIPKVISDIILKGAELSQDKRFQSATEMQKALRRAYTQTKDVVSAASVSIGADSKSSSSPVADVALPSEKPAEEDLVFPSYNASTPQSQIPTTVQPPDSKPKPSTLDATLHMSDVPKKDETASGGVNKQPTISKQADVKTEVLLAGDIPELQELISSSKLPASEPAKSTSQPSNFSSANGGDDSRNSPFSSYGNEPASGGSNLPTFSSDLESLGLAGVSETAGAGPGTSDLPEFVPLPPLPGEKEPASPEYFAPTTGSESKIDSKAGASKADAASATAAGASVSNQQKKSSSKAGLILGGLGAVFVLILLALGGGYYVYTNYYENAGGDPTPSPRPSVEVTPSPEPTVDVNIGSSTPEPSNTSTPPANTSTPEATPLNSNPGNRGTTATPVPGPTAGPFSTPRPTPASTNKGVTPPKPKDEPKKDPVPRPTIKQ